MLAKIRAALRAGPTDESRRRALEARRAAPVRPPVPARARVPEPERLAQFKACLAAQGTDVLPVAQPSQIPGAVADYLRAHALPLRLRRGADPDLAALPWQDEPALVVTEGPARADESVGLSRAVAGVAETGTLVLASGPHNPVTLAFVPDTHIVVVRCEAIVGGYEEACERLAAELGSPALPRTLNLISGASRTGDIAGRIVKGAHGPRRLAVILVEECRDQRLVP